MDARSLKSARNSILAMTVVASLGLPSVASAYTLDIQAYIDGRDQLILQGDTAQWEHFDYAAVGRWGGHNEATFLNGLAWTPDWPGYPVPNEVRVHGADSSVFTGTGAFLPSGAMTVTLANLTTGRGPVTIVQSPDAGNGYALKVEFNDNAYGQGTPENPYAVWYHVQLNITPVPEPETYAMFLVGLGLVGTIARRKILPARAA